MTDERPDDAPTPEVEVVEQELERIDLKRAERRELFSSRAVPSTIAAALIIVAGLYGLLECGLRIIGQPAWLIDPQSALDHIAGWPADVPPLVLGGAGVLLVIAGVIFLLTAVLPGRRARHSLEAPGIAVVVDDEVIASVLAQVAQRAAGVTRQQVRVVTSRTTVTVELQPTSGITIDPDQVRRAVEAELAEMAPAPMPRVRLEIQERGTVAI